MSQQRKDDRIGTRVAGKYDLAERLGRGGMGTVYRAIQTSLGREVALKIVRALLARDPEIQERFQREGQLVARLKHPNIVGVYDQGTTEDGELYVAMELIRGPTLGDVLKERGPLPPREASAIVYEVARALSHAHAAGVIHRDLKPENIMIAEDGDVPVAKILDFGVAKLLDPSAWGAGIERLTQTGVFIGTPGYIPPELTLGSGLVDARTDLHALGLIWLELLLGRNLYAGMPPAAVFMRQADPAAVALRDAIASTGAPADVTGLVSWLLEPDPLRRVSSADELLRHLDMLARNTPMQPAPAAQTLRLGSLPTSPANAPAPSTSSWSATPSPTAEDGVALPVTLKERAPAGRPSLSIPLVAAAALVLAGGAFFAGTHASGGEVVDDEPTLSAPAASAPPTARLVTLVPKADPSPRPAVAARTPRRASKSRKRVAPAASPAPRDAAPTTEVAGEREVNASAEPAPPARLTSGALREGLAQNFGPADACTNTNIVANGSFGLHVDHCPSYDSLDGVQQLVFDVAPDGSVSSASFEGAARDAKIARCAAESVAGSWEFPASEHGAKRVKVPVRFSKCVPVDGKCVFGG